MIVTVAPNTDPPYVLVEGIQSDRALSILIRAVIGWHAFGRYNHVVVDLTGFEDWSGPVVDRLATAAGTAADAGRWLAFFPADTSWLRGADASRLHCYRDRAQVQLAMRQERYAAVSKSAKRSLRSLACFRRTRGASRVRKDDTAGTQERPGGSSSG